jgi:hypothetical protein
MKIYFAYLFLFFSFVCCSSRDENVNENNITIIVPPENGTVSLVEKKQLNLRYVTAKKIQFRIQI